MRDAAMPWLSLLLLGAVHGINPAMGWLFAVGRGLQDRDRRAVWRAIGPLAAGHALAIGVAVLLALALGRVMPSSWLRWLVAAALLAAGLHGLVRHRHVRLGGMHVSPRELTAWSFLMASAHGAGLMVLPFVLGDPAPAPAVALHQHHMGAMDAQAGPTLAAGLGDLDAIALAAPLVHTLGYLLVTVAVAVVVYEKVGLGILRRAWINLDAVWAAALVATAVVAVLR